MERSSLGFHELLVQQITASPVYGNTLIRPCTLYRSAGINDQDCHNQRLPLHKPTEQVLSILEWRHCIIRRGDLERESGCTNGSNTRRYFFYHSLPSFLGDHHSLDLFLLVCICMLLVEAITDLALAFHRTLPTSDL